MLVVRYENFDNSIAAVVCDDMNGRFDYVIRDMTSGQVLEEGTTGELEWINFVVTSYLGDHILTTLI